MIENQTGKTHLAEPRLVAENPKPMKRPASLKDRWEAVRFGPHGPILGYTLAFTGVFLLISLFLWALESNHF